MRAEAGRFLFLAGVVSLVAAAVRLGPIAKALRGGEGADRGCAARTGTDFDTIGLVWQYRWGGGM